MPYTAVARNLMLAALKGTNPTTPITHVGLFDEGTPITGVIGTASTDLFNKTGHGLVDNTLVVLRSMTGGDGVNIFIEQPYFVITDEANTFQLSRTVGGSAINFTADISAVTVVPLVELSGGTPAYARKAIAFNTPVDGIMDDSTNGAEIDVPACTVNYVGFFSAVTAGTLLQLQVVGTAGVGVVIPAQTTFIITDADLDLILGGY